MPITSCSKCGGRFSHPDEYLRHLETCNPEHIKVIARAIKGLLTCVPETRDGER